MGRPRGSKNKDRIKDEHIQEEKEEESLEEEQITETKEEEENEIPTRSYVVDCWNTFITNFRMKRNATHTGEEIVSYPYNEQIQLMISHKPLYANKELGTGVFYISYEDLCMAIDMLADSEENRKRYRLLENLIKNHYDMAVEACREAVYNNLRESQPEYASYLMYDAGQYNKRNRITVSIHDYLEHSEISDFTGEHVEKFIETDGLVEQYDDRATVQIIEGVWRCSLGHHSITDGKTVLKECKHCDSTNLTLDMGASYTTSYMYVRIQQRADKLSESDIPKEIDVKIVGNEYVKRVEKILYPGAYIKVNGIIRTGDKKPGQDSVAIYVEASSVELQSDESLFDEDPELLELVAQPIREEEIDEHCQKLCRSIAPTLHGLEVIKEAILLMAVGGVKKSLNNGSSRRRGDIAMLLFGSPALGKTEMIKFAVRLTPKSQYVMAPSSTSVGITAGVSTADAMKASATSRITSRRILFGAYPLCSGGGICGVDELDKVKDKSLWHDIGQVMDEWQVLPLHKFGINRDLPCYCASIHAANPTTNSGQYDPTLSISEQCEFPDALLSRYDLIFPFYTKGGTREQERFLEHQRRTYAYVTLEDSDSGFNKSKLNEDTTVRQQKMKISSSGGFFSISYLRAEIKYLRDNFKPEFHVNTQAWKDLEDFFIKHSSDNLLPYRQDLENKINSPNPNLMIPKLDNRAFGTLLRLSEASAKLRRRNIVTRDDVATAIRLLQITIGALTPERDTSRQEMLAGLKFSKEYMKQMQQTRKREEQETSKRRSRNLKRFMYFMNSLVFERCSKCHGSGRMMEVVDELSGRREPRNCDMCQGNKGQYLTLRRETFETQIGKLQDEGLLKVEINEFFNAYCKAGILVLTSDGSYRVAIRFDAPSFKEIVSRCLIGPEYDADADTYDENDSGSASNEEEEGVHVPSPPNYNFNAVPANKAEYEANEYAKRELDSLGGDIV